MKDLPDTNEFKKLFPGVDVKNIKFKGTTNGSGDVYADITTGTRYLHRGRHWRKQKYIGVKEGNSIIWRARNRSFKEQSHIFNKMNELDDDFFNTATGASIPDTNGFKKLFPDVDVKNIKLTARTRGSGDEYVDTKTGTRYLYGGRPRGMGWRLDVPKFPNTEKRNPWTLPHLPDIDLFIEMFPDVNLASLKQEDTQFVDKSTGDVYAYNHVDGWKKMITREYPKEEDKSPPKLRELFPGVIFREVIPGIQYKDSNGNVYGKFENEGWKILPKPKY